MRTVLIDTLPMEAGKIFMIISGKRIKLSDCTVKAELYEQHYPISALGGNVIKKHKIRLVLCDDVENADFDIQKATGFDISGEILRSDGIYERIVFFNVMPVEIIDHDTWTFEVTDYDVVKRLFSFASY